VSDGTLLKKMVTDRTLRDVACVIVDECHERSVDSDIVLALLQKVRMKCKRA
jgi:HrpA-like RNA helicase